MKKVKLFCSVGLVGCEKTETRELSDLIDPEEWELMSEDEKDKFLDEEADQFMAENVEYGVCVMDDDEEE